jgi:hypothetical protein
MASGKITLKKRGAITACCLLISTAPQWGIAVTPMLQAFQHNENAMGSDITS